MTVITLGVVATMYYSP